MGAVSSRIQGRKHACFITERETEARDREVLPFHGAADDAAGASVATWPPVCTCPPTPTPWVTPLARGPGEFLPRRPLGHSPALPGASPSPGLKSRAQPGAPGGYGGRRAPMSCGDSPATRGLTPIPERQHRLLLRILFPLLVLWPKPGTPPVPWPPQFPPTMNSRVQESETLRDV